MHAICITLLFIYVLAVFAYAMTHPNPSNKPRKKALDEMAEKDRFGFGG